MKIDLFKLNNFNKLDIDSDVVFDSELYGTTDVRAVNSAHVSGRIVINVEDELEADLLVTGEFILPCAVTLEDVSYKFETKIDKLSDSITELNTSIKQTLVEKK